MSRFTGPQHRGALRVLRARRRREAEDRQAAYRQWLARLERDDEPAELAGLVKTGRCLHPWKTRYETQALARAAIRRMPKHRKGQGLNEYRCPAGHWHLGRKTRRKYLGWKAAA